MSSVNRLCVSPVSQTDVSRRLHLDEMPTCLTISRVFQSIIPSLFGLGIAKSCELRKVIAAIERIVRERRSRGNLQLRHTHAITQPAYNSRRIMRQSYVGQTYILTYAHVHAHAHIFAIPEITGDTSKLVRGVPSRLESNIEFFQKTKDIFEELLRNEKEFLSL